METKLHGWHLPTAPGWSISAAGTCPSSTRPGRGRSTCACARPRGSSTSTTWAGSRSTGPHALDFLQRVQTWDLSRLAPGRAHYSMLLNEAGGIIDDIFVYHHADAGPGSSWSTPPMPRRTAPGCESHAARLRASPSATGARTPAWSPSRARPPGILQPLCPDIDLAGVGFHRVVECAVAGAPRHPLHHRLHRRAGLRDAPARRPAASSSGPPSWTAGAPQRLIPCGLAARDSLRAEACLPLYGNEIDETTDPLSAGLARAAVQPGRPRLHRQEGAGRPCPARRRRSCWSVSRWRSPGVPRHGYADRRGRHDRWAG